MTTRELARWDAADHLDSPKAILAYLQAAFEDGDPVLIAAVLNDVARAKGVADAGLLAVDPGLTSAIRTMKKLGLELTAKAA